MQKCAWIKNKFEDPELLHMVYFIIWRKNVEFIQKPVTNVNIHRIWGLQKNAKNIMEEENNK